MTESTPPAHSNAAGKRRVLIVQDDAAPATTNLRCEVEQHGNEVIGLVSAAAQAISLLATNQPDIVLLSIPAAAMEGIQLIGQLLDQRRCPIIVVADPGHNVLIEHTSAAGVFGYLVRPINAQSLHAEIEVAIHRFQDHAALLAERDQLARMLETRKLVEKAKGIFMRRLNLAEPEAHKRLQQESQKRRISLAELARKIIESEELLGG
jgi:AmiR/NasT family two-component response regulator